jgi:hypothetical protein
MSVCPVDDGSLCWLFRMTCKRDSCPQAAALRAVVEDDSLVLVAVPKDWEAYMEIMAELYARRHPDKEGE